MTTHSATPRAQSGTSQTQHTTKENPVTAKPAMTMRQIREGLGHTVPPEGIPEPTVQPTRYVVSCLPEGHDDRLTFTVQVEYCGEGLWSVKRRGQYVAADGTTSPGFAWSEGPDEPATEGEMDSFDKEQAEWLAAHRFDHDTALRLAKKQAPQIAYRGYTVADALRTTANRPDPAP